MRTKHLAKIYCWNDFDRQIYLSLLGNRLNQMGLSPYLEIQAFGLEHKDQGPHPIAHKYIRRPAIAFYKSDGTYLGSRQMFYTEQKDGQPVAGQTSATIRIQTLSNWLIGMLQMAEGPKTQPNEKAE